MTLQKQVIESAAGVPVGVALLLTAVFVGITLLIAFWRKRKARRLKRKARRWKWGYFWAAVLFVAFGAYFLYLGFDDR